MKAMPLDDLRNRITGLIVSVATSDRIAGYQRIVLVVSLAAAIAYLIQLDGLCDVSGGILGHDFLAFFTAARFYLDGVTQDFYNVFAQGQFQHGVFECAVREQTESVNLFLNPPFAVLLYSPFALAEYFPAYLMWMAVGSFCFVYAHQMMATNWFEAGSQRVTHMLVYSATFFPVILWLGYGQVTGILFLILVTALTLLRRNQDFRAGLILGMLAFKPQIALCVALPIILNLRWKAMLGGATSLSAWLIVGWLLFPAEMRAFLQLAPELKWLISGSQLPELLQTSTSSISTGASSLTAPIDFPRWGVHSVFAFSHLMFGAISVAFADGLSLILTLAFLFVIASFWRKVGWQPGSIAWDRGMAGSFALSLLLGYHLFSYDLALLLIPFYLVLSSFRPDQRQRLDDGPILATSICIFLAVIFGPILAKVCIELTSGENFRGVALQATTVFIVMWSLAVLRLALDREAS